MLGDIFFRKYIVTFDKSNSRIGFSGAQINNVSGLTPEPTPVDPTPSGGSSGSTNFTMGDTIDEVLGWGLLGLLGVIALIGMMVCMCVQSGVEEFNDITGMKHPQFELAAADSGSLRRRLQ